MLMPGRQEYATRPAGSGFEWLLAKYYGEGRDEKTLRLLNAEN